MFQRFSMTLTDDIGYLIPEEFPSRDYYIGFKKRPGSIFVVQIREFLKEGKLSGIDIVVDPNKFLSEEDFNKSLGGLLHNIYLEPSFRDAYISMLGTVDGRFEEIRLLGNVFSRYNPGKPIQA